MPVFAQTCRRGPTEARSQARDPNSESIPRSGSGPEYREDDYSRYSKDSNLKDAVESAKNIRQLQTSNIDKYLAATGQSGRHGYAGTNRTITVGATTATKTGYITDKGLFKPWANNEMMRKSSGKYGCPVVAQGTAPESLNGYQFPGSNAGIYVGAAITQPTAPTTSTPAIFVGSDMTNASGNLIPACGNEGINVQVVYPGKATDGRYVGTYNIGTPSSTGYKLQDDIKNVTFQKCMERAEDKGMSLFSYTANKCYINQNSLSDATSAGLGLELKPADPSSLPGGEYRGGQQLLHFGKDGTLNVLNSREPSSDAGNIIYKFGLATPIPQCDFKEGGVIMKIGGSWGLNCNDIEKTYVAEQKLFDSYRSNDGGKYASLRDIIKTRNARDLRYEAVPESPVTPKRTCNSVMGRACGNNDGLFEEWQRRGGSCPGYSRAASRCTTGCEYNAGWGRWWCL
jgi:hypothetical protein